MLRGDRGQLARADRDSCLNHEARTITLSFSDCTPSLHTAAASPTVHVTRHRQALSGGGSFSREGRRCWGLRAGGHGHGQHRSFPLKPPAILVLVTACRCLSLLLMVLLDRRWKPQGDGAKYGLWASKVASPSHRTPYSVIRTSPAKRHGPKL